jgi:hypothetical protein
VKKATIDLEVKELVGKKVATATVTIGMVQAGEVVRLEFVGGEQLKDIINAVLQEFSIRLGIPTQDFQVNVTVSEGSFIIEVIVSGTGLDPSNSGSFATESTFRFVVDRLKFDSEARGSDGCQVIQIRLVNDQSTRIGLAIREPARDVVDETAGILQCAYVTPVLPHLSKFSVEGVMMPGSITVIMDSVPDDAQDFSYTTNGLTPDTFTLDDDADPALPNTQIYDNLPEGSYSITQKLAFGFTIDITCTDPDNGTVVDRSAATVDVDLDPEENIVCTFTNSKMSADDATEELIVDMNSMQTSSTTKSTLSPILQQVLAILRDSNSGNDMGVCTKMNSFLWLVNGSEKKLQLTASQAEQLRVSAATIKRGVGC